jgi:hypothetical protein
MKPLDMIRNLRLRNELDRLSSRQLRDLNLERVNVLPGTSIYQHRVWNGL